MEIQYFGANCIRISSKKATIVIDDNLDQLGKKSITKETDVSLFTTYDSEPSGKVHLLINQPGEYEVSEVSITGIPAKSFGDSSKDNCTIYKIVSDDVKLVNIGNISPNLTDAQLEQLGQVNVLLIPVGNSELTLSGADALKIIKAIEPDVVIPTHYGDSSVKYEKAQAELSEAIKQLAMEPSETTQKLKVKPNSFSASTDTGSTSLVILERS